MFASMRVQGPCCHVVQQWDAGHPVPLLHCQSPVSSSCLGVRFAGMVHHACRASVAGSSTPLWRCMMATGLERRHQTRSLFRSAATTW